MKKKIFISTLLICLTTLGFTQIDKDTTSMDNSVSSADYEEKGVSLGVNLSKYTYGEVSYFTNYYVEAGFLPAYAQTMNYGFEFSYIDNLILAPKIQAKIHVLSVSLSVSSIYYTDLNKRYTLKLRPEIGFGYYHFDINYGININIKNNNLDKVPKHLVSLRWYLPIKKEHINYYNRDGDIIK